jgi:hypothetical protein
LVFGGRNVRAREPHRVGAGGVLAS